MLMQLGPLAEQVADSIRQYQTELYVTVLNAYATASRVEGDADLALFVKEMKKRLATGPRTSRKVVTRIPNSRIPAVVAPPVKEH